MTVKYHIGIDLGTTNSVLAFAPADESEAMIAVLPIPQITAPGRWNAGFRCHRFCFGSMETSIRLS